MNGEFLIPVFLFGGTAAVLVVYFNNRHKERMAMIEKGVSPAEFKGTPLREMLRANPLSSLKWGLLTMFVGIGLMVGTFLERSLYWHDSVYPACMLIFGGLALILFYWIASRKFKAD
ncbi:MAG TPA: hypothetical protein DCP63_11770 [Bacteroidetes bacterium]|nr:hypothetical protein [Bacteroidota bacterium]